MITQRPKADPISQTKRCSRSGCTMQVSAVTTQPFCIAHLDKFLLMHDEVILATIREAGEQGAPSGIIYAAVMSHIPLETYQAMINDLLTLGKIRQSNNVLYLMPNRKTVSR